MLRQIIKPRYQRFGFRLILMAGLWFALNGADAKSWLVGVPTAIVAAAINLPFLPRGAWRWRLRASLPMLWFFLKESYIGAFDVARRALDPRLPIQPGFVEYRCALTTASARLFFADLISLMPGTLSARADDDHLIIHALDVSAGVEADLQALERKVAALFGEHHSQVGGVSA